MKCRLVLSALALTMAAGTASAAPPVAATGTTVTLKPTPIPSIAQFTVRVPVRLNDIGAPWKRGAVQCDYKAVKVQYMTNPMHPTDPPQEMNFEFGSGTVVKIFNLSAGGSYNSTLSMAWSWSGNEEGNKNYQQEYKCRLLLSNQAGGDEGWVYADDAGINRAPGAAYRVLAEGVFKQP